MNINESEYNSINLVLKSKLFCHDLVTINAKKHVIIINVSVVKNVLNYECRD